MLSDWIDFILNKTPKGFVPAIQLADGHIYKFTHWAAEIEFITTLRQDGFKGDIWRVWIREDDGK